MLDPERQVILALEGTEMLMDYIRAAMRRAEYEQLEDGSWYGHIPGFPGLWADGPRLEACREELQSALEDWVLFSLDRHIPVPTVDGIDLTITDVA